MECTGCGPLIRCSDKDTVSLVVHSRKPDGMNASKCQPEVLVGDAVSTSHLSCKRAGKTRTLCPFAIHLENLGLNHKGIQRMRLYLRISEQSLSHERLGLRIGMSNPF
jgi:hypothetical protein